MISQQLLRDLIGVGNSCNLRAGGTVHISDANLYRTHLYISQHSHIHTSRVRPRAQSNLVQAILSLNLAQVKDESRRFIRFGSKRLFG